MTAHFKWPIPPQFMAPPSIATVAGEDCMVVLNDARKLVGSLLRFSPENDQVEFRPSRDAGSMNLHLDDIKNLLLLRPLVLKDTVNTPATKGDMVFPPAEKKNCMVEFQDGEKLVGETIGFIADKVGLYLFLVNQSAGVIRHFIPKQAIKDYQVGKPLEQAPVDETTPAKDTDANSKKPQIPRLQRVDDYLADIGLPNVGEARLRSHRLGDYLTAEQIVNPEQIAIALERQKRTPNLKLGEALIQEKIITQEQLDKALSKQRQDRKVALGGGLPEDQLHYDPLLDCLVELTRIHGRPSTRASLSAGLPLPKIGLTPSLFHRAASRAGFSSKVVRRPLDKIEPILLPAILLLEGNEACLLMGWEDNGNRAQLIFPDTGQGGVALDRAALMARYTGIAIFSRPHFRFDQRTPQVNAVVQRHWFWGVFLEQLPVYRDVLVAAAIINVLALAMPLFIMNVYDRVVPNFAIETLWMMVAGILLVLGIDYALRLLRGHFIDLAGARIDLKLSAQIMERVMGMRMVDRPASVGSFAATLRSFESVRDFIASATVTALIDFPFGILFLLVLAWISWPLVFVPIIGGIAMLIYSYVIQHKMHELSETTYRATALRNATLIESLTALETVKAHGAEGQMQAKWEKTAAFLARTSGELRLLSSSAINGSNTLLQFVNLATVAAGVYLIHFGLLTMGGLIACTMLSSRAMAPMSQLVALLMQYQNARVALKSLDEVMKRPTERSDETAFIHRAEIRGEIEFRDVTFHYAKDTEPALKNVSFKIQSGEHIVILGRVGSGKTTLQKLMLGLYAPTSGAVYIDGVDLRQLDPADVRRNIGYVGQDSLLIYGSLRDNITLGAAYAEDKTVIEAAEMGGLSEFINRHPQGFDMLIGERGESISGGQRQGVAIARAVLLDPPILLLDEPTGSMDFSSEAQFKERLRRFAEHKTMIIVTHRVSLIDLSHRIIVLDGGKVVADGPREKIVMDLQSGNVGRASS